VQPDLARIAFVSRRFRELQGLRSAALGSGLIAGVVVWSLFPEGYRDPFIYIVLPSQMVLLSVEPWMTRYYDRNFGRVPIAGQLATSRSLASHPGVLGPFLVVVGMALDMFVESSHPARVSFGAVFLVMFSLWICGRDWPHRLHHTIGVAAGVLGVMTSSSAPLVQHEIWERLDPGIASHYALTYALIGLGLLTVGLLDHRLLAQAMAPEVRNASSGLPGDPTIAPARAIVAGGSLLVVLTYLAIAGWPTQVFGIHLALYLGGSLLMLGELGRVGLGAVVEQSRAYSELTRAREARFLAQMAAMRGEAPKVEIEAPRSGTEVPCFDTLGHLALPLAIACGALVDVAARGSGIPSFLALALAASHLRIALRDWPSRKHYLLGTLAASISAAHFIFVPQHEALDWTVWFLILVCAAMLVEGLFDYRLARKAGDDFSREGHAAAI
jgi:hypothetical protein